MKHSIHINQKQAMDLGIKNLVQGHIFDLLTGASTWASPEVVDGEVYYWVSRQRISEQLPLADLKPDTIYRNLKKLSDLGLIEYIKVGKKDCMRLTKKGKSYYVGSKSELDKNTMSDLNPEKLGSKSEKHSDLNPTYKSVNNISLKEDETEADRVALYLHKKILSQNPDNKSKPKGWVKDIDRAIRIDERTEAQLICIIDWMYTGDMFWASVVQSGKKLREKYDTMIAQKRHRETAHETHKQGNQLRGAAAQSARFHEDLKRFAKGVDSETVQQDAGDLYPPVDKRVSNY